MKRLRLSTAITLAALFGCDPPTDVGRDTGPSCACDTNMSADAFVSVDALFRSEEPFDAPSNPDVPSTCNEATTRLQAAAGEVLFLSESDRAIEVHVFAGEGTTAPTEARVVALAGFPATASHATRPTENFAAAFEPDVGASKSAPAMLVAAIDAGLSDLIYVAIIDPARRAEVHVILAGRTACGDLVLLRSISIET